VPNKPILFFVSQENPAHALSFKDNLKVELLIQCQSDRITHTWMAHALAKPQFCSIEWMEGNLKQEEFGSQAFKWAKIDLNSFDSVLKVTRTKF